MFQSSRVNSQIFILDNGFNPTLKIGTVVSVGQPRVAPPAQNAPMPQQYPYPMVVDIVVQVGSDKTTLQGLPADKDIADKNGWVIATTKDLILSEITANRQIQQNIIDNYDNAKQRVEIYDGMVLTLNPEEAEKKRNEQKIQSLEAALASQNEINQQLLQQLKSISERLDGDKGTTRKQKENA